MARHKDQNWNLPDGQKTSDGRRTHSWESIHTALLMDIRDELKALNAKLDCFRVRRMLNTVERIDRRLKPKLKLKSK